MGKAGIPWKDTRLCFTLKQQETASSVCRLGYLPSLFPGSPIKKKHPGYYTQVFFSPTILQGHHLIDGRDELPKAEVGQKGHYWGLG